MTPPIDQDDSSGPAFRINPYQAPDIEHALEPSADSSAAAARTDSICMDWRDRHTFLKTVAPLRLVAVMGGVVSGLGIFGLLISLYSAWTLNPFFDMPWWNFLRAVPTLLRLSVIVYICWLHWQLAQAIAKTAGGCDGSMRAWSQCQLKIAYVGVLFVAVTLLQLGWTWFEVFYGPWSIR